MRSKSSEPAPSTWRQRRGEYLLALTLHGLRQHWPSFTGGCALLFLSLRSISRLEELSLSYALLLVLLAAAVGTSSWRRLQQGAGAKETSPSEDGAFGALLLIAGFAVIQPAGGFESTLYPLVYLLVAFLAALFILPVAVFLTLFAILIDALIWVGAGASSLQKSSLWLHSAFLVIFAGLSRMVWASQVVAARVQSQRAIVARSQEEKTRAKLMRVDSATGRELSDEESVGVAVTEITDGVYHALELAECAIAVHSLAFFLCDDSADRIRLFEARANGEELRTDWFSAREGFLSAALTRGEPMRLCGELRGVTWYKRPVQIKSVLMVPFFDRRGRKRAEEGHQDSEGRVRGVIVADRLEAKEFTDEDERILLAASKEALRAMDTERAMRMINQAREDTQRLFRAIDLLNSKSDRAGGVPAMIEAIHMVTQRKPIDFIAITTAHRSETGKKLHRLEALHLEPGLRLDAQVGEEFTDEETQYLKLGVLGRSTHFVPEHMVEKVSPLGAGVQMKGLKALAYFPLFREVDGEIRNEGVLVCGARTASHLGKSTTKSLEKLGKQIAYTIDRMRLLEHNQEKAVTDALTGLSNHRAFKDRFRELQGQAARETKKLTLIITDIDHFKTVNDTYGHAIGDVVLRGVASIVESCARDSDVVARYGGEEFALLLPNTDAAGAKIVAERIREMVAEHVFRTELGPLRCTLSLGIATYDPEKESRDLPKEEIAAAIFDQADACLYHCKRTGRNRSATTAEMLQEERAAREDELRQGEAPLSSIS